MRAGAESAELPKNPTFGSTQQASRARRCLSGGQPTSRRGSQYGGPNITQQSAANPAVDPVSEALVGPSKLASTCEHTAAVIHTGNAAPYSSGSCSLASFVAP